MSVCTPNYEVDGNFPHLWCSVPECESSSVRTPQKLWIEVPTDLDSRKIWLNLALSDTKKLSIFKSQMYFCEDHFDLENDMENYEQYKTMGFVERVRMKPNCVPTRFDCQRDRIQSTTSPQQHQYLGYSPNDQPVSPLTQTEIPILLSLLSEDNCLLQDVTSTALLVTLFCVCCLARDVPFIRLVTCCHAEFLNSMITPEIKQRNQVICYQCHDMLKKIKQFKLQVEESFKLLSDSSENIPKNSNQRLNYKRQNFSMDIPDANRKKKPGKYYNNTTPQTIRIKPNIRYDHIINEETIEAKDKTKKSPTPKSSEKKDKQTKLIEEAFKIINSNQNSESINLLANSLQNLSSTLLSDMIYPNFDLGSQFDTTLPAEMHISSNTALTSNITTSSTENINYVEEENVFIADSTNVAVTPAISTENITDAEEENSFLDDSINLSIEDISTENFTNILGEIAFKAESSNIATDLDISTENLTNILGEIAFETKSTNRAINSSSPTENLISKIAEAFTNADIPTEILNSEITEGFTNAEIYTENKNRADSTDMATNPDMSTENLTKKKTDKKLLGSYSDNDYINFTNSTMSIEELINIKKKDASILNDVIDDRIICDSYVLDGNVADEVLIQLITEEEASIGEKQESVGGGESNVQENSIGVDPPETQESVGGSESNVQEDSINVDPPEKQESVGGGESNVQKDSIGVDPPEKQKSVGGGEINVQPVATSIALDQTPILGGNIKKVTLTREQLMEERAETAASQAYLRAPHKCESCIIGFQFHENLEDHIKRKHTRAFQKRVEVECDVCQQFVDFGASYDLHTFWHHTRYQCVFCEQVFSSYDKAALHHRKQHSKRRYRYRPNQVVTFRCPRCPFKAGRHRLLKEHMSECCTCKKCGVTFGIKSDISLDTHMTTCTGGAPSEPKRAKPTPT